MKFDAIARKRERVTEREGRERERESDVRVDYRKMKGKVKNKHNPSNRIRQNKEEPARFCVVKMKRPCCLTEKHEV